MQSTVQDLFPFDTPRDKQMQIIDAVISSFYDKGYKNVVLDSPTGTGKSAINTTVLRYAEDGFYTTPQRKLRKQLESDEVLSEHYNTLKARRDYTCGVTGSNCDECSINNDNEQSCSNFGDCTYWRAKLGAMGANVASITFAYLTIDSMLPTYVGMDDNGEGGTQISFEDQREVVVVDEAHGIEQHTAELHAGTSIGPYSLPFDLYKRIKDDITHGIDRYKDIRSEILDLRRDCVNFISGVPPQQQSKEQKQASKFVDKVDWIDNQYQNDNVFVGDVEGTLYGGSYHNTLHLTPVDVGGFLNSFVWSRGEKRLISTATMPYQDNPDSWLMSIGLDPEKTKIVSVGMPFDVDNRPVHTRDCMVASMSGGGDDDNWDAIMEKINELVKNHSGDKGLIHSVSYGRAERVKESIDEDKHPYLHNNVVVHGQDDEMDPVVERWQNSEHDVIVSPSMMEGVDLPDDMCRFQILLKVPYPPRGNERFSYLLDEKPEIGWKKYYETTMNRLVQSYGRGNRSKDDYAEYYILDEDFDKLKQKARPPSWFAEALDVRDPSTRSIFDY